MKSISLICIEVFQTPNDEISGYPKDFTLFFIPLIRTSASSSIVGNRNCLITIKLKRRQYKTATKTMKKKLFAIIFSIATIGMTISCSKENSDNNSETIGTEVHIQRGVNHPTHLYYNEDNIISIIINENNLFVRAFESDNVTFACVGEINGLSDITTIPGSGWDYKTEVFPKSGYVIRKTFSDGFSHYIRLYVVDYIKDSDDGIIGAIIRYSKLDF